MSGGVSRMLLAADWVLPVSRPPIKNGAVLVRDGRIAAVGPARDVATGGETRFEFPGSVLLPGLVNAHTHLSLTALEGVIAPDLFERWLAKMVPAMRSWGREEYAASAALGVRRCLESGVTVVGDIVYGAESSSAAQDGGVGGCFYWEVLGVAGSDLDSALDKIGFAEALASHKSERRRIGLSPHSPYTSGPDLLTAVAKRARSLHVPVAIHVAESPAETALLAEGTGGLAPVAERLVGDFSAPGIGSVAYLDRLGVLDGATAIHLGEAVPSDAARLAATARGVVTCPRSNRFLGNKIAPVRQLVEAGVPVGIGTDSSASNHDLDLLAELRILRADDPSLSARVLVEMATMMGAITLGLEDLYGVLEPGMQADFVVLRTGATSAPEEAVIDCGGRDIVEAVMSAGEWRVFGGEACGVATDVLIADAQPATARARAALEDQD